MSCCCEQSSLSGLYGLDSLMGDLSLPPVKKGARFQFGYNTGYGTGPFDSSDIAQLTNSAGITDGAVSFLVAGTLSYFIAVEGRSNRDWNSGSDLREAIYNTIVSNGYSIDPGSIQFNVETVSSGYTPPPVSSTRPPGTTQKSFWDEIAESLEMQKDSAQVVVLAGAALALILILKK
jgi:hypothetical protein